MKRESDGNQNESPVGNRRLDFTLKGARKSQDLMRKPVPHNMTRYHQIITEESPVNSHQISTDSLCLRTVIKERKEINSMLKNAPSYSINNLKNSPYKQIISKEHVQEMLGKETPGVGSYS